MRILGLDLGTNSLGWAYIDTSNQKIIGTGARIFPEGVDRDKLKREVSKNEKRRLKRQTRRQGFRRRMRREALAKALMKANMFPEVQNLREALQALHLNAKLKGFFQIDPYEKRLEAAKGNKLSLLEFGRVLYHLGQRRGAQENLRAGEEDGAIFTGKIAEGKTGINETEEGIAEHGTLGAYLASLEPSKNFEHARRRNRYTRRSMYQREFDHIWELQEKHHPETLTPELRKKIGDHKKGILFYQRPLKSQKHTIGKCPFEPKKARVSCSSIDFEIFRAWQFINSIRFAEKALIPDQKDQVYQLFLSQTKKFKFKAIKKKLNLLDGKFNYEDDHNIPPMISNTNFRKLFGAKVWDEKSDEEKEFIWHIKWQASTKDWLAAYAKNNWGFNEKQIATLCKFRLSEEYAHLSKKAIRQINPWLEKGFEYHTAAVLGGIERAFGQEAWNELGETQQNQLIQNIFTIVRPANTELSQKDRLRNYLRDEYGLSRNQLNKLYHHSDLRIDLEKKERLADPPNLRNPIVNSVLWEVKRVVNSIYDKYGAPDQIRVELAREMKSSKKHREDTWLNNKEREKERNRYKEELLENNLKINPRNVQKMALWYECNKTCPYTGDSIGLSQLFRDGTFEIEHILPRSRSLNDGFNNKTLCHTRINAVKGNKTPFEFYGNDEKEWEKVKTRVKALLPYPKYKHFIRKQHDDLDGFIDRQLNDTRYISRATKSYLESISLDVRVVTGGVTSVLRKMWGLNSILSPSKTIDGLEDGEYAICFNKEMQIIECTSIEPSTANKEIEKLKKKGIVVTGRSRKGKLLYDKSRLDHRHHAVDALVIASTKESYLQTLAKWSAQDRDIYALERHSKFPVPWESFLSEAKTRIDNTLVSHKRPSKNLSLSRKKVKRKGEWKQGKGWAARGPLHKETVYGRRKAPDGSCYFHVRKPLESLDSSAQVNKIVDDRIRNLIKDFLKARGIDVSKKYTLKPNPFFEIAENGARKPLVFLPNKNGQPVPIKKVRIREKSSGAVKIREGFNQWVEPGNNHHVELYRNADGDIEEEVVTFWQAVERKRQGLAVYGVRSSKEWELYLTLQENDLFLLGLADGVDWRTLSKSELPLYRVQKISSKYYCFRKVNASTIEFEEEQLRIQSFGALKNLNPISAKLNSLGEMF